MRPVSPPRSRGGGARLSPPLEELGSTPCESQGPTATSTPPLTAARHTMVGNEAAHEWKQPFCADARTPGVHVLHDVRQVQVSRRGAISTLSMTPPRSPPPPAVQRLAPATPPPRPGHGRGPTVRPAATAGWRRHSHSVSGRFRPALSNAGTAPRCRTGPPDRCSYPPHPTSRPPAAMTTATHCIPITPARGEPSSPRTPPTRLVPPQTTLHRGEPVSNRQTAAFRQLTASRSDHGYLVAIHRRSITIPPPNLPPERRQLAQR